MQIIIRKYKENDLNEVMASWESASKIAHPFMDDSFFEKERYNIPNVYIPNTDTWVAEIEGKVVGFIALDGNEIGGLFVDSKYHGKKVGWALLNKARELSENLVLDVFKENTIGRRFYERCGFRFVEEKVWDDTGDVLLRMELSCHSNLRSDS